MAPTHETPVLEKKFLRGQTEQDSSGHRVELERIEDVLIYRHDVAQTAVEYSAGIHGRTAARVFYINCTISVQVS